jgi:hypothetical protein
MKLIAIKLFYNEMYTAIIKINYEQVRGNNYVLKMED